MNRWQNRLVAAAVTAMTIGPPLTASAQTPGDTDRPAEVAQGTLIDHSLLDDHLIGNVVAQRQIIEVAAKGAAIADQRFDGMGLTRRAAYALTALRNRGDLPGAAEGQDPLEWWQGAEAKIKENVADQRLADSVMGGILVAGLVGMGRALMTGNIDGNQSARSPARRRREDEVAPPRSGPAP